MMQDLKGIHFSKESAGLIWHRRKSMLPEQQMCCMLTTFLLETPHLNGVVLSW